TVRQLQRLIAGLGVGSTRERQHDRGDAAEQGMRNASSQSGGVFRMADRLPLSLQARHALRSGYCPASVATSFQLGSREERSRAKVHTSVTSGTFSALPSITLPDLSRVTEMSWETKR